jgi:hypothetical protein
MQRIEAASLIVFWLGAALTIICAFCWRKTTFGNMFLIGAAGIIGMTFAVESKKLTAIATVGYAFALVFLLLGIRAALRTARGADAQIWRPAGMSGVHFLFRSDWLSGSKAKRFWRMQALCALLIFAGLSGATSVRLLRGDSLATPAPPRRIEITEPGEIYTTLNQSDEDWKTWPSPKIKRLAGEDAWGSWRPKAGDRGVLVDEMTDRKDDRTYYIVKIDDGSDPPHYVPMTILGFEFLEMPK